MAEAALVLSLTLLVGQIVFLGWFHDAAGQVARGYWTFLFVTWAAVRLEIHGVVAILVMIMTAIQGLLGAVQGVGFFAYDITKTGLANYWFFMMAPSVLAACMPATYDTFCFDPVACMFHSVRATGFKPTPAAANCCFTNDITDAGTVVPVVNTSATDELVLYAVK